MKKRRVKIHEETAPESNVMCRAPVERGKEEHRIQLMSSSEGD